MNANRVSRKSWWRTSFRRSTLGGELEICWAVFTLPQNGKVNRICPVFVFPFSPASRRVSPASPGGDGKELYPVKHLLTIISIKRNGSRISLWRISPIYSQSTRTAVFLIPANWAIFFPETEKLKKSSNYYLFQSTK